MNKHRITPFLLVVICLTTFAGCGNHTQSAIKSTETTDQYQGQSARGFFVETENGYYLMDDFFYYSEKDNVNFIKLCNKPECDHQSVDCNAYAQGSSYQAHLYNGKLFFAFCADENGKGRLVIASKKLDGTDLKEEKSYELPEGAYTGTMHGKYFLYNIVKTGKEGEQHSTYYIVDLEQLEKEPEVIFEYTQPEETKNAQIYENACVGDYVYYDADDKLYRYDIAKKQSIEIPGYERAWKGEYYTRDKIYQLDIEDNYSCLDVNTGERTILKKEEDENIIGPFFSDGTYLYRLNYSYGQYQVPAEYHGIFIYDMEGNRVDQAAYSMPADNNIYFVSAEDKVMLFCIASGGGNMEITSYSWFWKEEIGSGNIQWHDVDMKEKR